MTRTKAERAYLAACATVARTRHGGETRGAAIARARDAALRCLKIDAKRNREGKTCASR